MNGQLIDSLPQGLLYRQGKHHQRRQRYLLVNRLGRRQRWELHRGGRLDVADDYVGNDDALPPIETVVALARKNGKTRLSK